MWLELGLPARTYFAVAALLSIPAISAAQVDPSGRSHILLPPTYGATPVSTMINAQAAYIAATGDFLESAANARMTNALAVDKELDNSLKWVRTYFERKELNRSYTRTPNYVERQLAIEGKKKMVIENSAQIAMKGDLTDELNWLLRELNIVAPMQRFLPNGNQTLVGTDFDATLSRDDLKHILFTDGGQGQALLFPADSAEALRGRWPRVLRAEEFAEPRERFEVVRDDTIAELRVTNEISTKTGQQLMDSLDALCDKFNAAYPPNRRAQSPKTYNAFVAGKKYLQSLALGVFRMLETEDPRGFDGSYSFQGDSVVELVGHMHKFGLEFGPARPGDEAVYRKIFVSLRNLHANLF